MTTNAPRFVQGEEFLVLKREPADAMRRLMAEANILAQPGPGLAMGGLRAIILAALRTADLVGKETPTSLGLMRVYRCEITVTHLPISCEVTLVWGIDKQGKPKFAPDGRSQTVFLEKFTGTVRR